MEYLGGGKVATNKMKESGNSHWIDHSGLPPNASTNESGFTALPGGYRNNFGTFEDLGTTGFWWSSSGWPFSHTEARAFKIMYKFIMNDRTEKIFGGSVRCLRD